MTIKDPATVKNYTQQVMELRGALENLKEFAETLPAPDDAGNIPGLDYGHMGSIGEIHRLIAEASLHADAFSN